jgi:hypothetical protein
MPSYKPVNLTKGDAYTLSNRRMRLLETHRSGNHEQIKVICNKTLIVVQRSAETQKSLGRLPQRKLVRFQHTIQSK